MSGSRASLRARMVVLTGVAMVSALLVAAWGTAPAGAVTGEVGPVVVTVTPTAAPADGTPVTVEAHATSGDLFEIAVHLCRHGADIQNTFDFGFAGEHCTPNPVSGGSDAETSVTIAPGSGAKGSVTFRVGVGTSPPWTDLQGASHTLTCGNGSLCDLVVQLQVTGATRFFTAPLDGSTPVPPTTPPSTANPPDNPRGPSTTSARGAPSTTATTAATAAPPTTSAAGVAPTASTGQGTTSVPGGTVRPNEAASGANRDENAGAGSTEGASVSLAPPPSGSSGGPLLTVLVALVALAIGVGAGLRLRHRPA